MIGQESENLARAREVLEVIAEVVFHANALDILELLEYLDTLRPEFTIGQVHGTFSDVAIADLRHAHERIGTVIAVIDAASTASAKAKRHRSKTGGGETP